MAQNSDALQEPSMDELLASIREIIEENAGAPPQEAEFPPQGNARAPQGRGSEPPLAQGKQDIRVSDGAPIQAGGFPAGRQGNARAAGFPANGAGYAGNGAGQGFAPGGRGTFPSFPGSSNGRGAPAFGANGNSAFGGVGGNGHSAAARGAEIRPEPHSGQESRAAQTFPPRETAAQDAPVQDSMNALAERIGLRRNGAPPRADSRLSGQNADARLSGQSAAQQGNAHEPLPSVPPFMMPGQNSGNSAPAYGGQNAGLYPPQSARGQNASVPPQSRFAPQEQQLQGKDAGAERAEKMRFAEAQIRQKTTESSAGRRSADSAFDARGIFDSAAMAAELEKGLPGDVEHSTENLLRPFIAQWLDEHFRSLFEKVLREEVQRFIQSMRRS